MPLDGMTRRARNVVIANNDFATKDATVLTSPTAFVAGMGLSNILNDRLKTVCRTIGNSVILDLDMGYPVPASLFMLLGHNFTASARWRIRGARARSGAAGDAGGYTFALADTVYDTRGILASGTARGALTWTSTMLDHDFTRGTLPAGCAVTRASTGTYFDYTGTLRTAAADVARFDYDPVTKSPLGLLAEPTATNLFLRSEEFDNAAWSKTRSSISANAVVAPDGTLTADKLIEDATANNTHDLRQSIAKAASSITYTASIFVQAAERTRCFIWLHGASQANRGEAWFDLSAKFAGTTQVQGAGFSAATSGVRDIGGGWLRVWLTVTSNSDTTLGILFGTATANGNSNTNGDGVSGLYVWGAQIEAGSSPTSYIRTTNAAGTREADVPTMPTSALPAYSATAGTIIVKYRGATTAGTIPIVTLDDGTANERIRLVVDAGTMKAQLVDGGVTQADVSLGSVTVGTDYVIGIAWSVNDIAACINGGSVGTDASATLPTVTTLNWGAGWHPRTTYIAARVSNADLQTLTNPATSAAVRAATLAPYAGSASTTPVTLGTGSKTVIVDDPGLRFYRGATVRLSIDAANYMRGPVTDYDRASGRLTVNVTSVVGGGSATSMVIVREAVDLSVWPSVDPFGLSYWGDFSWGGQIDLLGEGYSPPGVHMPGLANGDGQPVYARYFKIEVQDTGLSWLDIGRLVVAAAYQPTINMQWDWRVAWVDPSQRERSRGGQVYVDGRKQWRVASLSLANIPRTEMLSQMYELRRAVGVRKPFALILDPTDAANLHRLAIWGSIPDATMEFSNPQFGDYRTALNVEEHF